MTQDRLIEALATASPASAQSPDCPADTVLAGYIDGRLDPATLSAVEAHLAQCLACRSNVAAAAMLDVASEPVMTVPELWLARARRLARRRARLPIPALAAAASVILALGVALIARDAPRGPPLDESDLRQTRESRFVPARPALPEIAFPASAATIAPADLAFRWSGVAGARYYDVRIVDDDGDLVWTERVNGTDWAPGDRLALAPGAEYYVRVDAYVDDAKPVSSPHVPFSVRSPP